MVISILVFPCIARIKEFTRNSGARDRHCKPAYIMLPEFNVVKFIFQCSGDQGTGVREAHAFSDTIGAASPSGIDEPYVYICFADFFAEHLRIARGMEWHERCTKTRRKSDDWFCYASLGACDFCRISADEMESALARGEFRNWRKHSIR